MIHFKCPKCGHTELEEIMTNAIVSSVITEISDDGYLEYEQVSVDDGTVDRYQCSNCGWVIKQNSEPITDSGELIQWLKEQKAKSKRREVKS